MSTESRPTRVPPQFPDVLPQWAGLIVGVLLAAFIIVQTFAASTLGRPSSTAGIGYVMGPILGLAAWAGTFLLGMLVRSGLRRSGMAPVAVPRWLSRALWLLVLAAIPAMYLSARSNVLEAEFARRPRVIIDSQLITPIEQPATDLEARVEAPSTYALLADEAANAKPVEWNGRTVTVRGVDEHVVITDGSGNNIASADLREFDYITRIRASPVCRQPDGNSLLAVLVTLRATSHRSMLLLFGTDGRIVYQHHLDRLGGRNANVMYVGLRNGHETLVVDLGVVTGWTCAG